MDYTVTQESFDTLEACRADSAPELLWSSVFVLPVWMRAWWQSFRPDAELYLRAVWQGERIIGIAPLMVKGKSASFVGSPDVCDYLDFVAVPGEEGEFFGALLDGLKADGVNRLDLHSLRPDSAALHLEGVARQRGYRVSRQQEDISVEMDLPRTWEEYLKGLSTKQRHEIRRKSRRLSESGDVRYRVVRDSASLDNTMDAFLKMFSGSRQDKAGFLSKPREAFFRSLATSMAEEGMLRLGVLELDTLPAAMVMGFNHRACLYLYNSGYEPQFDYLSVGLLCKVFCIQASIEEGEEKFDFLRGGEVYKYRLGGREIPLYHCQIALE